LGRNYLISSPEPEPESNEFNLVSMNDLLVGKDTVLESFDKDAISELRFTKRLDTNELVPYYVDNIGRITKLSKSIQEVFELLDLTDLTEVKDLIGYTEGMIIYRTYYENYIHIKTNKYLKTPDGSRINGEVILPDNWDRIEYFSDQSLILREKPSQKPSQDWYLLKITRLNNDVENTALITKLGKNNDWLKLDLFTRTKINPFNLNILMSPIDGKLMKYSIQDDFITKLEVL